MRTLDRRDEGHDAGLRKTYRHIILIDTKAAAYERVTWLEWLVAEFHSVVIGECQDPPVTIEEWRNAGSPTAEWREEGRCIDCRKWIESVTKRPKRCPDCTRKWGKENEALRRARMREEKRTAKKCGDCGYALKNERDKFCGPCKTRRRQETRYRFYARKAQGVA